MSYKQLIWFILQETKKGFIHKYLLEFNQIFIIHSLTHYQYDFNYLFLKKYNSADWLKTHELLFAKLNRIPLDHSVPRQSFWRKRSRRRRYKAYILALKCKHGTDLYSFAALIMTKKTPDGVGEKEDRSSVHVSVEM